MRKTLALMGWGPHTLPGPQRNNRDSLTSVFQGWALHPVLDLVSPTEPSDQCIWAIGQKQTGKRRNREISPRWCLLRCTFKASGCKGSAPVQRPQTPPPRGITGLHCIDLSSSALAQGPPTHHTGPWSLPYVFLCYQTLGFQKRFLDLPVFV